MKRASPLIPARAEPASAEPGPEPSDAEVIRRSDQEPDQFAVLFERHAASIAHYVSRRLGPDLAQDIVADTFLTAFRQRGGYDLTRPDARPWLFGIAGNLIRRHHRDEARKLRALARTGTDPVLEPFTDQLDAQLTADTTNGAVAAAIASLDPDQRDVVLLITWAELTYDQAADALGIAPGTVRSRMSRARARLRAALADLHDSRLTEDQNHG